MSDITGKTGMDIIRAIIGGERDPQALAKLRDYRSKADEQTIAKALQGHWQKEHLFELAQLYDTYQEKIAECDRRIEAHLNAFEDRSDGGSVVRDPKKKKRQHNAPHLDLQTHLYRMTGMDYPR